MKLVEITDASAWDNYVSGQAQGHPLQLWGWGEAKRGNGWTPHRLALQSDSGVWLAAAQVLAWPIPKVGRRIMYVPRGPVAEPGTVELTRLLTELVSWAKTHRALYLRLEPAWREARLPGGWRLARNNIQLAGTYTLDLAKSADELLAPMARKHRQYIRKAERDGVTVARVTDGNLVPMLALYGETAGRAGFGIHTPAYYEALYAGLGAHNYLYYAYYEGQPVAFLWLAAAGRTAYELYGGVNVAGQEAKANYYLKWSAIVAMRAAEYTHYDFNGRLNDGVAQFKQGFAPETTDYVGTWDYPLNRAGYELWERLWPVAKPLGRKLAQALKR